ncbi:MAG TPA: type III restriction-modification system endonuclease, partial [Campylobacterales bacterium]|nr:type III restriction-modification system endonuclease [Campylobacterales bacterium]
GFNKFLLDNSIDKFSIGYAKISNTLHPTKFTDENAKALSEINASDLGVHLCGERTASSYLFEELFYDSELEKENIKNNISEVIVFTKIPKKSIRIPVAGGGTYSPDFAYIVKKASGEKTLNLIVETKDKEKRALFKDEAQKIKHAEILFSALAGDIEVVFRTQFEDDKMADILKEALRGL